MKSLIIKDKPREYEIPKLKLTTENVKKTFLDCFLPENYADDTKIILVSTVTGLFGFDPEKIEKHALDIQHMISQLSSKFDEINQGYTFMGLPFKDGNDEPWGEQIDCDHLMALGLASGWMKLTIEDRTMWNILPGAVPYVYRLNKRADTSNMITTVRHVIPKKYREEKCH